MAHTHTSAWRAESASPSLVRAERESEEYLDSLPTAHPGRELFTASVFVLTIIAFLVWGGWKLISLL